MFITILLICSAVSAVFCIRSKYVDSRIQLYIFKPLTTGLIFFIAFFAGRSSGSTYWMLILVGILFSLAGDIFLMLPSDRFIAGLLSFFGAHLVFTAAFYLTHSHGPVWALAGFFVFLGVLLAFFLLPSVGQMKWPVMAYIAVILIMAWQAWERWMDLKTLYALSAAVGASLFLLSDYVLAYNRFKKKVTHADAIVLGTYYSSITLIALSSMG